MIKKKIKFIDKADAEPQVIYKKEEDISIIRPNEEIKSVGLSSPTIGNLKGSQPMKPNALTMTKIAKNNKNTSIGKNKKIGDGAFITAEDR